MTKTLLVRHKPLRSGDTAKKLIPKFAQCTNIHRKYYYTIWAGLTEFEPLLWQVKLTLSASACEGGAWAKFCNLANFFVCGT